MYINADHGDLTVSVGDDTTPGETILLTAYDVAGVYPTAERTVEVIALL